MVSVTTRLVMVAIPVFETTTRYTTDSPTPGFAGVWVFPTLKLVIGAPTNAPTTLGPAVAKAQALVPVAYAVSLTCVGAHTTPTDPLTVNVSAVPGRNARPALLHANSV